MKDGEDWEKGFCEGVMKSRFFVPLISAKAIERAPLLSDAEYKKRFSTDEVPTAWCDNVLLEHRISLELKERKMIEKIFPIFISPPEIAANGLKTYAKYYPNKGICSTAVAEQVEIKLRHHLLEGGQGLPIMPPMSVIDVIDKICKCNGDFFMTQNPADDDASAVRSTKDILLSITEKIKNLFTVTLPSKTLISFVLATEKEQV